MKKLNFITLFALIAKGAVFRPERCRLSMRKMPSFVLNDITRPKSTMLNSCRGAETVKKIWKLGET